MQTRLKRNRNKIFCCRKYVETEFGSLSQIYFSKWLQEELDKDPVSLNFANSRLHVKKNGFQF